MDKIAVLDFGGQYAHLIANRIRRLNVYSEILDGLTPAEKLKEYKGIILSGGPQSVYDEDSIKCDPGILELGVPLLGICYGHQLLAYIQGSNVEHDESTREYGLAEMDVKKADGIFKNLSEKEIVWMSHGDTVKDLPSGYEVIGSTRVGEWGAIANFEKNWFGVQFHLEVTHTKNGQKMLENFLDLCGAEKEWSIDKFIEAEIEKAKNQVGDKKVFMLVSGGVDSTVAYALLAKALGEDRLYGLFVDTGFMRLNEREQVMNSLQKAGFNNLHVKDASETYYKALENICDPEAKRKIIGDLFLKIQEKVVEELNLNPDEWLLGQGTIYPDTIESGGTKHAAKIKTHHNRVERIDELMKEGKLIEPLVQLYKDEVRAVGEKIGLSSDLIWRHPFPGPGLAVRCLCAQEESYPYNHQLLQDKINNELSREGLTGSILPIRSVGVQGDDRSYRNPIVLAGSAGWQMLNSIGTELINQYDEINRAVWLLHPQKIQEINIRYVFLTRERIALLQKADAVVTEFIHEKELNKDIWQFPTVLLPISINSDMGESLVLRPVESEEAMTAGFYHMDPLLLGELTDRLRKIPGITAIFYDITNKPPGTIEWE
jgi:GMP synthase (glutamine-hydrolysing)